MKKKNLFLSVISLLVICGCNGNEPTHQPSEIESENPTEEISESTPVEVPSLSDSEVVSSSDPTVNLEPQVLYCSPDTDNYSATGTMDDPMLIQFAIRESKPGATIYLLDGTYRNGSPIDISTATELYPATCKEEGKTIKPLNKGKVKFDFSSMKWESKNRGISINTSYWHIEGLEVFGAGDNGIYIGGHHNVIENCVTHDNGDTGIQLGRASSALSTIDKWPSYNLIKNCTSYDNHDPLGEDSDGFACKLTTGVGNVFDGCIAYNNVDDGWDLYTKGDSGPIGPVTLINCIAFNNGITSGKHTDGKPYGTPNSDGNGFKLGGESIAVQHEVYNCIAYNNLASGFTDNSNPGTIRMENCTSYNNSLRETDTNNFDMCRDVDTSINYLKNCFSYSDINIKFTDKEMKHFNSKDQYKGTVVDSIFYYGRTYLQVKGIKSCDYSDSALRGDIYEASMTPFVSTEIPSELADYHDLFRDENGNISLGDFLKIKDEFVKEAFGEGVSLGANLE